MSALAESCYRHAATGRNAGRRAYYLGRLLLRTGRYAEALTELTRAVAAAPRHAEAWNSLGVAREQLDNLPGAKEAFEQAIKLKPAYPLALNNLGKWHIDQGEARIGLAWLDKALALKPIQLEALNNRVVALLDLGQANAAEQAAREALQWFPDNAALYLNLGNACLNQTQGAKAREAFNRALVLNPYFEEVHFNLAILLGRAEYLGAAVDYLKKQVAHKGDSVDLLVRLAVAQSAVGDLAMAEACCHQALTLYPNNALILNTLAGIYSTRGEPAHGLDNYRRALEGLPQDQVIHANVLFTLNYLPGYNTDTVFAEHLDWAKQHAAPLQSIQIQHQLDSTIDHSRRLKLAYVSPDLCNHPVGHLIRGIIQYHDKTAFEIHCYSGVITEDALTRDIRSLVDGWHDTLGVSDTALCQQIVEDGIDILVDLAGHTANNRLLVFARRPAPVQVEWIGYFHSTGMTAMDYFITDPYTSPLYAPQYFSEIPVRLPHTRFCYTPPDFAPEVSPAPCLRNGYITFGSFNKLAKMSDIVYSAWADILLRVPESRLLLKTSGLNEEATQARILGRFADLGITAERIILRASSPHRDMLAEYADMDIALDPFPYNGGMTTLEALLMGLPVVALAGNSVVSRQTTSILLNMDCANLVFNEMPAYIDGAIQLACDFNSLVVLRSTMRDKLLSSPICQSEQFTRDLESLYRRMWAAWCDGKKLSS